MFSQVSATTSALRRFSGSLPEPCDVGSFKLLGWELLITGTWNCLTHTSLNSAQLCTSLRANRRQRKARTPSPQPDPTQHNPTQPSATSTICLLQSWFFFSFLKLLVVQCDGDTNCCFLKLVAICEQETHVLRIWIWKRLHCGFFMCDSVKKLQ